MAKRKAEINQAEIVRLFGLRLRETRLSRGMTQADLAHKAQVTTSHIWKLESGGAAPGIDVVDRLAKVLGVPIADLLPANGGVDSTVILKENAIALFNVIISSENRDVLLALNPLLACMVESMRRRP